MKSETKSIAGGLTEEPTDCPFREFKDAELSPEFWGMNPSALRAAMFVQRDKGHEKASSDSVWVDEQIQPLTRSVRHYLDEWVRAEELASSRWEAEVVIFEDNNDGGRISAADYMYTHTQVLLRSSFCRRVLSICFMLERFEGMVVEHQWDGFVFNLGPEGWRPKFHIYSPGLKAGGGPQHRPVISKNGCYLVRLFYVGCWRCVWVNDKVPVDGSGSPLLPFSPIVPRTVAKPVGKQTVVATSKTVQLWPLLLSKALLKLAAPDMSLDYDNKCFEDEYMDEFDIIYTLTGGVSLTWRSLDINEMWAMINREVPPFTWDDEEDAKAKVAKKPTAKDASVTRRMSMASLFVKDTKDQAAFVVPGVTPAYEFNMLVNMARDIPLKKPLPEPDVPLWKTYRWVDWAREHGLYDDYKCPRTKFLKCSGLLKSSYTPHLLDMQSTESITMAYKDQDKNKKSAKEGLTASQLMMIRLKEEYREWVLYESLYEFVKDINVVYFPSMLQFASAFSAAPLHPCKGSTNRSIDLQAPRSGPLYIQIDGGDEIVLRICFNVIHPRVLFDSGQPLQDNIEPAYLFLEEFNWFEDINLPMAKAFLKTRSYGSIEVKFVPGRHYCRLWVNSHLSWNAMLITESNLLMSTRDQILCSAVRECSWTSKFLYGIGTSFITWLQRRKSLLQITNPDKDFYKSYSPDLPWDFEVVGYPRPWIHWMFRKAVNSMISKRLVPSDYRAACILLRRLFYDPEFGLPDQPPSTLKSIREAVATDPCDCDMSVSDKSEAVEALTEELIEPEEKPIIDDDTIAILLSPPEFPIASQLCELATEEVPCGLLRIERDKALRRHEAAIKIQSHWRRIRTQKCLSSFLPIATDIQKAIIESSFGSLEALQALMNEFFALFPGARAAYSVGSALSGVFGLQQFSGVVTCTPKCKWVPYFQTSFKCHVPVKVNFDLQTSIPHSIFAVYDNDTGKEMDEVFNYPLTYDFYPNEYGYIVIAHGSLEKASGVYADAHWQLTVMSSIEGVFHVCDHTDFNYCKEIPLQEAAKVRVEEIFIPNRRNILGGIQLAVSKRDCVSFRAASSSPEMFIEATLKSTDIMGKSVIIDTCKGKGEIYWPLIILQAPVDKSPSIAKRHSSSHANLISIAREKSSGIIKTKPKVSSARAKSSMKIFEGKPQKPEARIYTIEVVVPDGWPLTLSQWSRIEVIRNTLDVKPEGSQKKSPKERVGSAKEKEAKSAAQPSAMEPQPGDAYVELEVSVTSDGGVIAKRDDERDVLFAEARRLWESKDPGRNLRGAQIRKDFRDEYLVPPPPTAIIQSTPSMFEEAETEAMQEFGESEFKTIPAPTLASENVEEEISEVVEELIFLEMPECQKDKFEPLYFVPLCTRDLIEESALVTPEKAEAAKTARQARAEAAYERMRELQLYNEVHIIGRQKRRCCLVEKLYIDAQLQDKLVEAFDNRDDVVALEGLNDVKGKKK